MKLNNFYRKKWLFTQFVICSMILASCSTSSSNGEIKTRNNYKFKMITDAPGEPLIEGDNILFGMKVFAKDSMLMTNFDQVNKQEFKWLPETERLKMNNPVVDAFELMSSGDSAIIYYPIDSLKSDIKYGLESGESLMYVIKLFDVMDKEKYALYAQERQQEAQVLRAALQAKESEVADIVTKTLADYKSNKLDGLLIEDPSGLEYIIHKQGQGALPKKGENVNVHYYGVLKSDGTSFDNSYKAGKPFPFPLGQQRVIPGWDTGVALMKKGTTATFFIPFEMAYGVAGRPPRIPEKSDLVFYIDYPE